LRIKWGLLDWRNEGGRETGYCRRGPRVQCGLLACGNSSPELRPNCPRAEPWIIAERRSSSLRPPASRRYQSADRQLRASRLQLPVGLHPGDGFSDRRSNVRLVRSRQLPNESPSTDHGRVIGPSRSGRDSGDTSRGRVGSCSLA
jgi:hypothetical protein